MARENIFRFKQFSVRNELSAMKVGTDGVLIGAWADVSCAKTVLDVGTGTGLVALMAAQRCQANITAVEIDRDAVTEATYNFEISPWKERLSVIHTDFNDFCRLCNEKFDLVVSNPPYFINSLECPDEKRGQARHTSALSYEMLLAGACRLLTETGCVCIITPADVECVIESIVIANNMNVSRKTYVKPTPESSPKRIMWKISHCSKICITDCITIEKERHIYTDDYISLTKDYYLNM